MRTACIKKKYVPKTSLIRFHQLEYQHPIVFICQEKRIIETICIICFSVSPFDRFRTDRAEPSYGWHKAIIILHIQFSSSFNHFHKILKIY